MTRTITETCLPRARPEDRCRIARCCRWYARQLRCDRSSLAAPFTHTVRLLQPTSARRRPTRRMHTSESAKYVRTRSTCGSHVPLSGVLNSDDAFLRHSRRVWYQPGRRRQYSRHRANQSRRCALRRPNEVVPPSGDVHDSIALRPRLRTADRDLAMGERMVLRGCRSQRPDEPWTKDRWLYAVRPSCVRRPAAVLAGAVSRACTVMNVILDEAPVKKRVSTRSNLRPGDDRQLIGCGQSIE